MQHPSRTMPPARKAAMDNARKELRAAIGEITACSGQIIEGVYSSNVDGAFDVENVVFYNIGAATFRNASRYGLRARRCRETVRLGVAHALTYRMIPTPAVPKQLLATLSFTPDGIDKCSKVWLAASGEEGMVFGSVGGKYGIYVELAGSKPPKNPASVIKSLFDGVIAAMQADLCPDETAIARLATTLNTTPAVIRARLDAPAATAIPALPTKRLVQAKGPDSVHWYPADDLCEECTLVVKASPVEKCNVYVYAL